MDKPLHSLLAQQLGDASESGSLNLEQFLQAINEAYAETDRQRVRTSRANRLMAEEIELQTDSLRAALRTSDIHKIRFEAALDAMPQALSLFDSGECLVVCNKMFRQLYALPADFKPEGRRLTDILAHSLLGDGAGTMDAATRLQGQLAMMAHIGIPVSIAGKIEQTWPSGQVIRISRNPVDDGGFIDLTADITESHSASARIAHMAHYDTLTDLPNRTLFHERLAAAVNRCGRSRNRRFALLCMNLDRFKVVNDTLGYPVGDALLIQAAERLRSLLRVDDLVARLSGDEFSLLVTNVKRAGDVHRLADRIISRLSAPYHIKGHQVVVGVSIGIEFSDDATLSADDYLRNADLALSQAKAEGRGCACVFKDHMHETVDRRRQLELELRHALKRNEFVVWYQPQFCVKQGIISGFEALVRWQSPRRGLVSPLEFISLSEETGLIDELGAWVLRRACADAAAMPEHLSIAVNLSPVQFRSRGIIDTVKSILRETGLAPHRLELEITEGIMIADAQEALQILRALKALGVKISLDDFGTGYSSLNYIRTFPFDKIKIDQSFVRDLGHSDDSLAIIRAVSGICTSLGICSVAEGVETDDQFQILKTEKCDSLQGYLFGRPTPVEATRKFYEVALQNYG
ncbi:putative bifunctional diguanylate cyclase/phosphodiesterase [Asticcacaulis sp. 201]|uniref:putative bifunctional diguanylate cyclase/phosphodiesterase n=1 Tax=Asticcacaulis sp. 201 TaxID=3028787 RepID=UPI0029171370|nr:EAL domain-containing protein [Asticcacaulis sp. 201]MDV6330664.1 EAL domain-containing protein [Asticcacaulis sp. 201]